MLFPIAQTEAAVSASTVTRSVNVTPATGDCGEGLATNAGSLVEFSVGVVTEPFPNEQYAVIKPAVIA